MEFDSRPATPPATSVVLRRRPRVAAVWALLGTALVAAGGYFVADSGGHPIFWAMLGAFTAIGGFFVGQFVVPPAVQVRLDPDALRANLFGRKTVVAWDSIHVARVRPFAGDPMLHLEVREPSDRGDAWRHRAITVVLPVGCDLRALHRYLSARLGVGPTAPRTFSPLDV